MRTAEQELLKSHGYKDYMEYDFVGIEESPIGEKDLSGREIVRVHFKRKDDSDISVPVVKLDEGMHPTKSGVYLINDELKMLMV